jgi:hypothetical protein
VIIQFRGSLRTGDASPEGIVWLKDQLERELHDSRVARAGDLSEQTAAEARALKSVEVGVVQDIKRLRTELQADSLREVRVLVQISVPPRHGRSNDRASPFVAGANFGVRNKSEGILIRCAGSPTPLKYTGKA